ncbi:Zn-ribbon domain-containing OB-fold protein [Rhodococcus sp. B50]|uniref:Zn-ribbon domain-containing OB-fold protein n=1 Tax=Rhodococcus sp. B50 TaxID=2682847 RepID=UPI0019FD16B6|nr:OB-fold domain-containing protein [Rhodococcus sp. B50]
MTAHRPLPLPDANSKPYWAAAAQRVLALPRCRRCHGFALPPDSVCPNCGSSTPEFEFVPVSGHGTVRSWTIVRRSFLPGFDDILPFVLVDVELREQTELRMIGRLLDGIDVELRVGTPVSIAFEDLSPEISLPAFELAG